MNIHDSFTMKIYFQVISGYNFRFTAMLDGVSKYFIHKNVQRKL